MTKMVVAAVAAAMLSGCAAQVKSVPVGGSRADGTVTLAYEYGALIVPQVNYVEMQQQAQVRCARWGYQQAERFGGQIRTCVARSSSGCLTWRVSIDYQCQTLRPPA